VHKYWVDELYEALVVNPIRRASDSLWRFWDEKIVDGAVNGVGAVCEAFCGALRVVQTGNVGTYAFFLTLGVLALLLHFLRS
jgi:NADH-quinone oxidoreductase subunit L